MDIAVAVMRCQGAPTAASPLRRAGGGLRTSLSRSHLSSPGARAGEPNVLAARATRVLSARCPVGGDGPDAS
jgi:hypothetical protein